MILVDDRTGSKELLPYIHRLSVPAYIDRMKAADFQFFGNGPQGEVLIGVERKTVPDLIDSLQSKRYAGEQLPKLRSMYQPDGQQCTGTCWIFVEGDYRSSLDGAIEIPVGFYRWDRPFGKRPILTRTVDNFLTSSTITHGIPVKYPHTRDYSGNSKDLHERDKMEFCRELVNLYWWWQKPWDEHKSHTQIYCPSPPMALGGKVSLCRSWANQLDGIGWDKSAAVEAHFGGSAYKMANASRDDWRIPGVIGDKLSLRIVSAIRGRVTLTDEPTTLVLPESLVPAVEPVLDVTVTNEPDIVW